MTGLSLLLRQLRTLPDASKLARIPFLHEVVADVHLRSEKETERRENEYRKAGDQPQ
jgi:hypothetical protein